MEGGGEGMVAMVRWLSDAGLAFGFLSSTPQRPPQNKESATPPSRNRTHAAASQTLSENQNNGRHLDREPYASTYQIAHCGVNAGSPAYWHTEFPPQRKRPSSALGNFEVGSNDRNRSPALSDIQSYQVDKDPLEGRGCQIRTQQERDVEAFVSSLRKYPSATKRSPPAELLEQLLKTRSHSRKQSQSAVPPKKRRHHWDKPRPLTSLSLSLNKHKENNRRLRRKKLGNADVTSKEKECSLPGGPISITTFDYLNSGARSSPGTSGAKKIENKLFKNVFRNKYRDKRRPVTAFPVCPTLQSRYEKHLKQYHPTTSKVSHVDFKNLETCSKCLLKRPCPCQTVRGMRRIVDTEEKERRQLEDAIFMWLKDIPIYPNENPHDKFIRDAVVKKLAETLSGMNDKEFATEGKEEIRRAVHKMPMWYPKGETEREIFENSTIENLLEKIKGIKELKKFHQNVQGFYGRLNFQDKFDAEQALNDAIIELDKIALNRPSNYNTYRDLLKMKSFELLDRLPIKTSGNKYEYLNRLSDELADVLLDVTSKSIDLQDNYNLDDALRNMLDETTGSIKDRANVEEKLRAVIADVVANEYDKNKARTHIKNIIEGKVLSSEVEKIINKTLTLADGVQNVRQKEPHTKYVSIEDVRDIIDNSNARIKNRDQVEENLRNLVSDIAIKDIDGDEAEKEIKSVLKGKISEDQLEDITNKLLELADQGKQTKQIVNKGIHDILAHFNADIEEKEKVDLKRLVAEIATKDTDEESAKSQIKSILKGKVSEHKIEDIASEIYALADQIHHVDTKPDHAIRQIIKQDINDILETSSAEIKNKGKIKDDLHKIITDVATERMGGDRAEKEIRSILKGKVSGDRLDDITNQYLELADQTKQTKQNINRGVRDILEHFGADLKNKEFNNLNNIVAEIVAKGTDEEKAKSQIKSFFKGKVPKYELDDITDEIHTLVDKVKQTDIKQINPETKQIIKEDLHEILETSGAQIKDKRKVKDDLHKIVTDVATKGLNEDNAKILIKSLLKGKVSNDKVDYITDQVLELANKVTPVENESKKLIKEDIHDILDLSDVQVKDKEKVAEILSNVVADINIKGLEEEKAKSQIKSILKGKVSEDKLEDIEEQVLALGDNLQPVNQEAKQFIKEDVNNILDHSGAHVKNREKVAKHLGKVVADITTKGLGEEKAKRKIKYILKGKVSEDKLKDILEQVLALGDNLQRVNQETEQFIKEDVRNILDRSETRIKNRGKLEEHLSKLITTITKQGIDSDKAELQIKSVLKGKVSEDKLEDITKQVVGLAQQLQSTNTIKSTNPKTEKIIKRDISDILNQSKSYIKDKSNIEEKLRHIVSDLLSKRIGEDKAKNYIKDMLKGKVPEDNVEDITFKVLELANDIQNKTMYPESQETFKHEISDILDYTKANIKNRDKVEESLRDILNDLIMRGMDKSKAQDYIDSTLKGNVPDSQIEEISKKIFALAEHPSPSFSEYSGGPIAHSTQNEDKIFFDQVFGVTRDWLKNLDIISDKKLNEVAEAIANEMLDRQKYLKLNPGIKTSEATESEILKEQIYKILPKLIDKKSVQLIISDVEDLMRCLKQIPTLQLSTDSSKGLVQDSIQFIQENLEGALLNWLRRSPIYQNTDLRNKQSQEQIILKLAKSLSAVLASKAMQKPDENLDNLLLKEIRNHVENLPSEPKFKSRAYIQSLESNLLGYLKNLQIFQDISARDSQGTLFTSRDSPRRNASFMSSTNHLNDIVKDWCEALPLSDVDGPIRIKQDFANKIILKIGEMNMNPDIFNDDPLYDEILLDFIDQQVNELQIDEHVTGDRKKVLLDQIKQIRQVVQDDYIGRKYKQLLRETISKILPSMVCATGDDLASFELIKENLADAFINLNYCADDERAKAKFKRRIMDEVNKYIHDYLRRCPATPLSTRKLNEDLYNALKNVPVPVDESMRTEVESVRMKDIINDWLKTLPMTKQTISEQLHMSKIVTLMAQKLQELENEFHPDFDQIAQEVIALYLKKLPLKNKNNLAGIAKKMVEKIKNTAESRVFVEGTRSKFADDCLYNDFQLPRVSMQSSYPSCASFIPPCGLSKEDQEIMQRIRQRSLLCEAGTQSRRCKDVAINPPPLDHGSQTEMPCHSKCCQHAVTPEKVCSKSIPLKINRIPISTRPCPSSTSQADLSPYVVVKEYYWDSNLGKKLDFATQTSAEEPARICISSSPLTSEHVCRPRTTYTTPRKTPVKSRTRLESFTCRKTIPKRQFTSACPNEYFSRPKHCSRSPPVVETDYLRSNYRHLGPTCSQMKSPCLSCKENPKTICHKCFPMHVCPHPTCLYFK